MRRVVVLALLPVALLTLVGAPVDATNARHEGHIRVPLDRADPAAGHTRIGYEIIRRRDRDRPGLGTILAVEGGPGYSTTDSRTYYRELFGPLLDRRRLLLIDLRGTGSSGAINCPQLQAYEGNYTVAVGRCGRQLGAMSDVYGSAFAARDVVDVLDHLSIRRVDLYGDSYGTFFSQAFAVRHPERVRTLILDAAYFVGGTEPWYSDTNRAIRDAFRLACTRSPACADRPGGPMRRIARLVGVLRNHPLSGHAPDADGVMAPVSVGVDDLIDLVTYAAYSPTIYRELDAAARAVLRTNPYQRPLLRMVREIAYEGGAGPVRAYSEGLYDAVACLDYPQPYAMDDRVRARPAQFERSVAGLRRNSPRLFAPFTVDEWVGWPFAVYNDCLRWPRPSRWVHPVPRDATYPDVPTLVLAGDLDSLTSPEGARDTADAFPDSTFVKVANVVHVTALVDFDTCASVLVRRFIRTREAGDTSCAADYHENRLVDRFVRSADATGWVGPRRRTARVAAATSADVMARWLSMYGGSGVGLSGGTFTVRGGNAFWAERPVVRWRLDHVRWVGDVSVTGRMAWHRNSGLVTARLRVSGSGAVPGRLRLRWYDTERHATATAHGRLGGAPVEFAFPAS